MIDRGADRRRRRSPMSVYAPDRKAERPAAHLQGFRGILQVDGYAGYRSQFEREVTGERIRDKIAASKKKGMWMGGLPPLGYDVKDRKLVVNVREAETVRHIYRRYAALGSVLALKEEFE